MKIRFELLAAGVALATAPAWAETIGPQNFVQCSQALVKAVGTATTVTLLTGVSGKIIYLCGWSMTNTGTAGTGSFQLTYGTATTCSANNAALTSVLNVSNTSPATDHVQFAQIQVPNNSSAGANPDLCLVVTSGVGGLIYIGQY